MKKETIYPQGIKTFSKRENAPDFVKGSIVISIDDFNAWVIDNKALLTEYNGKKQLRLQILDGNKGLYLTVDTYKKEDSNF
jgi:hypothetical protein